MHPPASTIFIFTVQFGRYEANIGQECSVFLPDSSYIQTVKVILQGWTVGTTCQSEPYHTSKVSLLYNIPCCSLIVTQCKLVSQYFFKTKRWFFFLCLNEKSFSSPQLVHLEFLFNITTQSHQYIARVIIVTYIYIYVFLDRKSNTNLQLLVLWEFWLL